MGRRVLGIDEAGRGCVLGPMVFGAALADEAQQATLVREGVRDSKLLSDSRRRHLAPRLRALLQVAETRAIPPATLDGASLNALGTAMILTLAEAHRPDVLIVDAPVPPAGLPAYRRSLREGLAARGLPDCELIAENEADRNHPLCAAASILAKVERDDILASIEGELGEPLGSGYPSDPATQQWLARTWSTHRAFPAFVRHKWDTVRRVRETQERLF